MKVSEIIKEIAEENATRDMTHPIGAVYKSESGYWRVCRHGSKKSLFEENGITRSIRSGFTSEGITKCQYMKAVFFGRKAK